MNKGTIYRCGFCGKEFRSPLHYASHEANHERDYIEKDGKEASK